jgi:hypothetical protein
METFVPPCKGLSGCLELLSEEQDDLSLALQQLLSGQPLLHFQLNRGTGLMIAPVHSDPYADKRFEVLRIEETA